MRNCKDCNKEEKMQQIDLGRMIQIISHQMIRYKNENMPTPDEDLTTMQKHVLHHILMETMHHDIYQKDIEKEFEIRKSTATGILKLMEKNGYITRVSETHDGRLKKIVPTPKSEALRESLIEHIRSTEKMLTQGVSKEDAAICRKVLFQMHCNLSENTADTNIDNEEADRKDE